MPLDLLPVVATTGVPAVPAASVGPAACCTPLAGATISEEDAVALARTLRALADPARLRLLSLIAATEGAEACVCDLVEPVGLSQPTVSHHLKQLTEAGLVTRDKRGVWAYYALVPDALATVTAHLGVHLGARTPV